MKLGRIARLFLLIYLILLWGGQYSFYNPVIFQVHIFHEIFLTLFLGGWLIARLRRGDGIPALTLNTAIYGLLAAWFLSALTSQDPRMSIEKLWPALIHLLLFWYFVAWLQSGQQRSLFEFLFIIGLVIAAVSYAEIGSWFFGLGWTPGTDTGWVVTGLLPTATTFYKPSMLTGNPNLLASFSAPLAALSLGWAWTIRARDYRIVLTVVSGLLALITVLTLSRGGWLSLGAALLMLAVFWARRSPACKDRINPQLLMRGTVFVLIILAGFVTLLTFLTDTGRREMWRSAVEISRDYPLTGAGFGMYGRMLFAYRESGIDREHLTAHNTLLNHISETGLVGLAALVWALLAFGRATWRNWQSSRNPGHRRRIEICLAVLVGISFHAIGEAFYFTTATALLILILVAYCVTPLPAHRLEPRPLGQRLPAWGFIGMLAAYGVFFSITNTAQAAFLRSLDAPEYEVAAAEADQAIHLDPALRLYTLHRAHLEVIQAFRDPLHRNPELIASAAQQLEAALALEPNWSWGWMNLAALREAAGDLPGALQALGEARRIDLYGAPNVHWARIAEQANLASEEAILEAYGIYLKRELPLAAFWMQTPMRQQAMEKALNSYATDTLLKERALELAYRVLSAHDPRRAGMLLPERPARADEWWVLGEHALTVEDNPEKAVQAFTEAIKQQPYLGDYYVSRARALLNYDLAAAEQDLQRAKVLRVRFENPSAVTAQIRIAQAGNRDEERRAALESAYPLRLVEQSFPIILFRRPAIFDIVTPMRPIGPGRAALEPWYTLAQEYEAAGDRENARRMYLLIYRHAPDEEEALEALRRLEG